MTKKTDDAHGELFREASVRGRLREGEEKFGAVLAEKNIDLIFSKLLEKLAVMDPDKQAAEMDAMMNDPLAAHPLLDSQAFDGMENDLNLNPDAIVDPAQRQELRNRLELKNQLKMRLQQKFNPTPLTTNPR
jgi:hypothetical protein